MYIYIYGLLSKSSTVVVSFFHFVSSSKKAKTKKTTNFASVFLVFFRFGALQIWSLPGSFTLWKRLAHISCPQSSLCRTHIFPGCFLKRSIEQRGGEVTVFIWTQPRPSLFLFVSSQLQQGFRNKKPGHFFGGRNVLCVKAPNLFGNRSTWGSNGSTTHPHRRIWFLHQSEPPLKWSKRKMVTPRISTPKCYEIIEMTKGSLSPARKGWRYPSFFAHLFLPGRSCQGSLYSFPSFFCQIDYTHLFPIPWASRL